MPMKMPVLLATVAVPVAVHQIGGEQFFMITEEILDRSVIEQAMVLA